MPLFCGRDVGCVNKTGNDFRHNFLDAKTDGYSFIVASVTHPICCVSQINENTILPTIVNDDSVLEPHQWASKVIGQVSPWIDLDSPNPIHQRLSVEALKKEISYFNYLGLSNILINLKTSGYLKLAKFLCDYVFGPDYSEFVVLISLPMSPDDAQKQRKEPKSENYDAWVVWRDFRLLCGNHWRLAMVFQFDNNLPNDPFVLKRWLGEPIYAVTMKTTVFEHVNKQSIVLTKPYMVKWLLNLFGAVRCQAIVEFCDVKKSFKSDPYLNYLERLWAKKLPPLLRRRATRAHADNRLAHQLGAPMTPLSSSLNCENYLVFEMDRPKYVEYKRAILTLLYRRQFNLEQEPQVVMVLGAGRGPLVTAVIEAYKESKNALVTRDYFPPGFKIYAVEHNYGAIPTLMRMNREVWENRVIVVHQDMREFRPAEKADLIVSELLGSFGDNELSPECLDGVSHLLKDNCVSIPCCCQSFLAPVHSPRLVGDLKEMFTLHRNPKVVYERTYVSWLVNSFEIAESKMVFEFKHPNFEVHTNERDVDVEYEAKETSEVAAFAGYFFAQLFDHVNISTVPETHTCEMGSWSPLIFPLREPVLVEKGKQIVLNIRRCCDGKKVWYEWKLKQPVETAFQNVEGRFFSMSLKSPTL